MASYCNEMIELTGQTVFRCCTKDLLNAVQNTGLKADLNQIRNILKDNWGVHSENNSYYTLYSQKFDGELDSVRKKGRFVEIEKSLVDKILL